MTPFPRDPASRDGRHRRYAIAIAGLGVSLNGGVVGALALACAVLREPLGWMRTPLDLPLAAWLGWLAVSAITSDPRRQAIMVVLGAALVVYLAYQVPYRWFRSQPHLIDILSTWAVAAVPMAAALGLASYLLIPNPSLGLFRRFSLGQAPPGIYAFGLHTAALLGLGVMARRPWLALVSLAAGVFGLIGSLSRWGLLGLAAGMSAWALMESRQCRRAVAAALATAVLAAALTISLPMMQNIVRQYVPGAPDRGLWTRAVVVGLTPRTGFPERLAIWEAALRMIGDHPWLGVGPASFPDAYRRYMDPAAGVIKVPETPAHLYPSHAHNDVLAVAVSAGIPGAAAYVVMMILALVTALRRASPRTSPAAAALVAIVVHGAFDAITVTFAGPMAVFWLVLAAAVHPGRDPREKKGDRPATA